MRLIVVRIMDTNTIGTGIVHQLLESGSAAAMVKPNWSRIRGTLTIVSVTS